MVGLGTYTTLRTKEERIHGCQWDWESQIDGGRTWKIESADESTEERGNQFVDDVGIRRESSEGEI